MIGTNKLTDDVIKAVGTETKKCLDTLVGNKIIDSYIPTTVVATRDANNRNRCKVTFSYYRIRTFKLCTFDYYVI